MVIDGRAQPAPIRVLAIGGPTASGKTALAIALGRSLNGEIVNADSRQVYRGMDVGTAKPTPADRALVPHHLLDVADPRDNYSLAMYVSQAHEAIRDIAMRGRLPILVGGTGLYLRAVVAGYAVPAVEPNQGLRQDLEQIARDQGPVALVERLRLVDPTSAARIDGRNVRRVIRALEVTQALGVPFSSLQHRASPYNACVLVLEGASSVLYERADLRLEVMLEAGFMNEVSALLAAGYNLELPAMSALGYRELAHHIVGDLSYADALAATRANTHAFIKRQMTWFRAEKAAVRLTIGATDMLPAAVPHVEEWLGR